MYLRRTSVLIRLIFIHLDFIPLTGRRGLRISGFLLCSRPKRKVASREARKPEGEPQIKSNRCLTIVSRRSEALDTHRKDSCNAGREIAQCARAVRRAEECPPTLTERLRPRPPLLVGQYLQARARRTIGT